MDIEFNMFNVITNSALFYAQLWMAIPQNCEGAIQKKLLVLINDPGGVPPCVLLHNYNLCFNGSPCDNVS